MRDLAVSVKDLSKQYRIGANKEKYRTLRDTVANVATAPFRRVGGSGERSRSEQTIWALRNVSFEARQGEAVGIIGRNGAGKSTLLKVLSRITEPTTGCAEIHGRVGSLLEVGTGFHPELTGRENVYLNGAILGMKRPEIERKFDEIVDFAGVEKFIDTPVKRYSSGMYLRLAFAVAAHLEPDILIVDEVLAVGDAAFQKKCIGKMGDVASNGRTVLFVSHNMPAITTLCERGIVLQDGTVHFDGSASSAVTKYLVELSPLQSQPIDQRTDREGDGRARVTQLAIANADGGPIAIGDDIEFRLHFDCFARIRHPRFNVSIKDELGNQLLVGRTRYSVGPLEPANTGGWVTCVFRRPALLPGEYRVMVSIIDGEGVTGSEPGDRWGVVDRVWDASMFVVAAKDIYGTGKLPERNEAMFIVPVDWTFDYH